MQAVTDEHAETMRPTLQPDIHVIVGSMPRARDFAYGCWPPSLGKRRVIGECAFGWSATISYFPRQGKARQGKAIPLPWPRACWLLMPASCVPTEASQSIDRAAWRQGACSAPGNPSSVQCCGCLAWICLQIDRHPLASQKQALLPVGHPS